MKILEPGNVKKKEWTLTVECDSCGAKLLLDQDDLYKRKFMNTHAKMEYYTSFICIQCKAETNVDLYRIPDEIYGRLLSEKKWCWWKKQQELLNIQEK